MPCVERGTLRLADGAPVLVAAEVGLNHNGDLALAHRLIDAAANAGAGAVKFQSYRTEDFLADGSLEYEYESEGRLVRESQRDMFKRCEVASEDLAGLAAHCADCGIVFFSTPTSEEGVADLHRLGVSLLKNGSDYLVHLPLIRAMARSGIPTVISTGMATLAEIDDAVRAFREAGGRDLVLLRCTSSYPTPPEDVHLRSIPTLGHAFECPVGLSDHTDGVTAAVAAVALGACMIEKHFTLDRSLPGPDHRFSSDPAELRRLVDAVRETEQMLGSAAIGPAPSEELGRREFRLSIAAGRALPASHRIEEADVAYLRPGTGLPPAALDWVLGRRLAAAVPAGTVLTPAHFESNGRADPGAHS